MAKGVAIPDVVDLAEDDARTQLEDAGFEVRVRDQTVTDDGAERPRARPEPRRRRGAPQGQPRHDHRRPGGHRHAEPDRVSDHDARGMRVAVLAGGRSSEHEVSLSSAAFVREAVAAAGHEVLPVTVERTGAWTHDGGTLALEPGGGLLGADAVFPVLHGPFGEDGTVQGLLELLDVPYVGAGVLASSLCMDKVVFKEVLAAADVPQVGYAAVREHRWRTEPAARARRAGRARHAGVRQARPPGVVGRDRQGVGRGRPRRRDRRRLRPRRAGDRRGVLGRDGGRVLGPRPARARGLRARRDRRAQGRLVRLRGQVRRRRHGARRPARGCPTPVIEQVRALAVDTFLRVGCAGLARVDFFVEGDRVLVNELNTMPGFTQTSAYPKLWEATGIPPAELCDRLLGFALERFGAERSGHAF